MNKEDIQSLLFAIIMTALTFGIPTGAYLYLNHEVRSESFNFVWKESRSAWTVSNREKLPKNITSPYGFMHNACLKHCSYTLVVPYNRMGTTNKVRVHIW